MSVAARALFGAVAIALPDDPVTLALLLIQEFQHVKLSTILDPYDLQDPDGDRLFPAPWEKANFTSKGSCGALMRSWR